MSSMPSAFLTRPGFVLFPVLALVRKKTHSISELLSWRRALSGWGVSPSFTRNLWMSLDERPICSLGEIGVWRMNGDFKIGLELG
jgi:hypothetical protein